MKRKTSEDLSMCSLSDSSYNSLCKQTWERCEFCEKTFNTRLASIKHNATHIVIPLLKLSLHQCDECLFHFTSLSDLRDHAASKKHRTSQFPQKSSYKILERNKNVEKYDTITSQTLDEKSVKIESIELSSDSERYIDTEQPHESIKSKIMFEDDYDDDLFEQEEMLDVYQNSYIVGSKVTMNDGCNGESKGTVNDECNGESKVTMNDGGFNDSVGYDELVEAEICDCKYCGRCFVNRLELIKHETTHMQISRTLPIVCYVCEQYISGNHWSLRKHLQKHHPNQERKLSIQKCSYCNLNYHNYLKHANIYHFVTCKICDRRFDRKKFMFHDCNHYETAFHETVVKMCEMCLTFTKNRQNIHYEVISEHSEIGTRQQCDKCLAKYFEVKLVKRKVKVNEGWRIKKPMSNKERLKKMQNRLKMANKMRKSWFLFYL